MNYDGTNASFVLQGLFDPRHITPICFQNEVHETTFTTNPSTSENTGDLDAATSVTDHGDTTSVPGMYTLSKSDHGSYTVR